MSTTPPSPGPSASPDPRPAAATQRSIPTGDEVGRSSARISDLAETRTAPVRVRVPGIGVDAPIVPVGVRDGDFDVLDDVTNVGWYRYGPAPGDAGSSVLAAHVDTARDGPGVFFRLRELAVGDTIHVTLEDGTERSFSVVELTSHPKEELPTTDLFARDGDPRLALITCGGSFDPSLRRYTDNIVAIAVPIGG